MLSSPVYAKLQPRRATSHARLSSISFRRSQRSNVPTFQSANDSASISHRITSLQKPQGEGCTLSFTPFHQIPAAPVFSYTYKLPIFYPLCFDIHTCNGGCTPPCCRSQFLVRHFSAKRTFANRLFYSRCKLFQDPYRVSPVFATLTKTPGVYTNSSRSGTQRFARSAEPSAQQIPIFQSKLPERRSRPLFLPFTLCVHSCTVFLHILPENGMVRAAYHVLHTGHSRFQHRRSPEITWN
jgi:hypothetical protein